MCRAVSVCEEPANQKRGHRVRCTGPFVYQSTCEFACDAGYEIPAAGTAVVNCIPVVVDGEMSVDWDAEATPCEGELASKLKRHIFNIMFIQANNFIIYLIIYLFMYLFTYVLCPRAKSRPKTFPERVREIQIVASYFVVFLSTG